MAKNVSNSGQKSDEGKDVLKKNNSLEVEGLLLGYSSITELLPNMNKDLNKIPRATRWLNR